MKKPDSPNHIDHPNRVNYKNPAILIIVMITAMSSDIAYKAFQQTQDQSALIKAKSAQIKSLKTLLVRTRTQAETLATLATANLETAEQEIAINKSLKETLGNAIGATENCVELLQEATSTRKAGTEAQLAEYSTEFAVDDCKEVAQEAAYTHMAALQECSAALAECKNGKPNWLIDKDLQQ